MITFSLLYLFLYILIFLSITILSFLTIPFDLLIKFSMPNYFTILQKYTNNKFIVMVNFLFLTGLPPFGLFLVKFNILTYVLYHNHFVVILMLFFLFLLNMFYYAQIFNYKNYKNNDYSLVTVGILKYFNNPRRSLITQTYLSYRCFLSVINIFFFVLLSLAVYTDCFFLINL
jgi:hypothetical protein